MEGMPATKARKALAGFKAWHNKNVKPEYKWTKSARELADLYLEEMLNTGGVELPSYMTKTGNPLMY